MCASKCCVPSGSQSAFASIRRPMYIPFALCPIPSQCILCIITRPEQWRYSLLAGLFAQSLVGFNLLQWPLCQHQSIQLISGHICPLGMA